MQELKTNVCLLAEALQEPDSGNALIESFSDTAFRHYCQQGYAFEDLAPKTLSKRTTSGIPEFNQYLQQSTMDLAFRAYQRIHVLKAFAKANSAHSGQRRIQSLLRYHIMLIAHIQNQPLRTGQ
ncbi:hypothetical protein [Thalassotalea litorea]|uniref:hypothetical protein n=1 Tax=Thalassotalea litorea TaxID=2020715 RepID=UPI0037354927